MTTQIYGYGRTKSIPYLNCLVINGYQLISRSHWDRRLFVSQHQEISIDEKIILHIIIKLLRLKSYSLTLYWPNGHNVLLEVNLDLCVDSVGIQILYVQ